MMSGTAMIGRPTTIITPTAICSWLGATPAGLDGPAGTGHRTRPLVSDPASHPFREQAKELRLIHRWSSITNLTLGPCALCDHSDANWDAGPIRGTQGSSSTCEDPIGSRKAGRGRQWERPHGTANRSGRRRDERSGPA